MAAQEKNAVLHIFRDRLERAMKDAGVNQPKLALETGISQSTISRYASGKTGPKLAEAAVIAKALHVDANWLLGGRSASEISPEIAHAIPRMHGGPYWGMTNLVRVVSWASAGEARAYDEQGPDAFKIPTNCKDPNCYALEIEGDSMEPIYQAGDYLVAMPNREAKNGDLVVAKLKNNDAYFKKAEIRGESKSVRLVSYNPKFPVMDIQRRDLRFLHPVHSVLRVFIRNG